MRAFFFTLLLLTAPNSLRANPSEAVVKERVEKFFADISGGRPEVTELLPKEFSANVTSRDIDLSKYLALDFQVGTAYGSLAFQRLNKTYSEIRNLFNGSRALSDLVGLVETLVDVKVQTQSGACELVAKMAIKVPVLANFHVEDRVNCLEDRQGRGILTWKQISAYGELVYNQGLLVAQPSGAETNVAVYGVHIIKEESKVPWIGRSSARSFSQTHYGNFIRALSSALNPLAPMKAELAPVAQETEQGSATQRRSELQKMQYSDYKKEADM